MSRTQGMDSPPASWPKAVANPGFAGDTGEFTSLTEDDIRGLTFVGIRPKDGGHPSVAGTMPYMLAEKHPDMAEAYEREHILFMSMRLPK